MSLQASLPGALAHHFQVVLLQLGSKQGVLILQLLDLQVPQGTREPGLGLRTLGPRGFQACTHLLPEELIVHLQPLCLLEGLLHALVGLA